MEQQIEKTLKPTIYRGRTLPLCELTPNSFEDFSYQSLSLLGKSKGFEMQSGRQPSGDQGFDCTARTIEEKELVCIQCKRYTSTLQIRTVAEEIIKVALDSNLNNTTVTQHYIITSGTISSELRKALRQDKYLSLKEKCRDTIKNIDFKSTLEKIEKNGCIPYEIIVNYIDSLDKLIVWSGVDFHNELLVIWSDLKSILEHHFSIETVLREKPTPDFSLNKYLYKVSRIGKNLVPLYYTPSPLPNNLKSEIEPKIYDKTIFSIDDIIILIKNGENIILSSPGGSGKTSSLTMIGEKLTLFRDDIEHIPVRINLRSYSRNTLNTLIEQELGITYGSWKNLPFKFIFLLDGLDEMLQHDTQAFHDDLVATIGNNIYLLTVRSTGISVPTIFNSISTCLSIQPLSYRSAFKIASYEFNGEALLAFYNDYRDRLNTIGYNFLSSPFVLSLSIDFYKNKKTLPQCIEDVLDNWILNKIEKDKGRVTDSSIKLNTLFPSQIIDAFSLFFYKANFDESAATISEELFIKLVTECYHDLCISNQYIYKILDLHDFISMIHRYEILYKDTNNNYLAPHKIISDYLSSKTLAKNWKKYKNYDFIASHHDIWLYTSSFIIDDDKKDFLNTTFNFDICLSAKVAKKLQGNYIADIQHKIIALEKNEKVITRSNAIYALGILGTEDCYNILRSQDGCIDYHHPHQRRRALALNGDKETLLEILDENESKAQAPIEISGGSYSLWFSSPPTIITNIARERINSWLNDQCIPLCMALRTLALFGDSFDIKSLTFVLINTNEKQEFFDASKALLEIDRDYLIDTLLAMIEKNHNFSYFAKEILISMDITCSLENEFYFFIEQGYRDESELIINNHHIILNELVTLIRRTYLDDSKINILIDTYKKLNFSSDFFYYGLVWALAKSGKPGCFLPIVELAYSRNKPCEIHYAISYLADIDILNISNELSILIDNYFENLDESSIGTFLYYAKYYYRHHSKDKALNLIAGKIKKITRDLLPEKIAPSEYNSLENGIIFNLLAIDTFNEIILSEGELLKLLLIGTEFYTNNGIEQQKKIILLNRVERKIIDKYANRITDPSVKTYVVNYLLLNNLSNTPLLLLESNLLKFLSHHMFYPTIEFACLNNWSNDLADLFLTCFIEHEWNIINAQMFEKYTDTFLSLISKEQLNHFEKIRTKNVPPLVGRIYQIWLEHHNIT